MKGRKADRVWCQSWAGLVNGPQLKLSFCCFAKKRPDSNLSWREINLFKFLFHKLKFDHLKIVKNYGLHVFLVMLTIFDDKMRH